MKKLTSRAIFIAGAVLACHCAFGQPVPNDLYLGFENTGFEQTPADNSATVNYIINLGPASGIVGGSSVVNLSSEFSLADFSSAQLTGDGSYPIVGGVIGGQNNDYASTADVYLTQLRNPATESPAVPGSTVNGAAGVFDDDNAFNAWSALNAPTNGAAYTGILDSNKTWQAYVDANLGVGGSSSFYGEIGIDPDSIVPPSGILYEDLWESSSSYATEPYIYLGYFMLDLSGATPVLTFTPSAANVSFATPQVMSTSESVDSTTTTIVCSTVASHYYTLEYATDLTSGDWTPVGSEVEASGSTTTFTDTSATDQQRYYRVIAHW